MENDIRRRLGKSLIFRYLDEKRQDEILAMSDLIQSGEGESIITEGEESPYLYLVASGEVSVSVREEEDRNVYVSTLGEGEIFGEAGIFLKTARTANVSSLGESRVLRIHREKLLDFIRREPSAGVKLLMIIIYGLLKKLRESNQELAYERKGDIMQDDVDALVESVLAGT